MANNNSKIYSYLLTAGLSAGAAMGGAYLIAPNEGLVKSTYLDPVNILTACYGHTGPELKKGQNFTDEQCLDLLAKDVSKANKQVKSLVKVPLNAYQEAALTSFTYNAGYGNFASSTMLKKFNSKDYVGGCQELTKWVYATQPDGKKVKLNGLVNRRDAELDMCLGKTKVGVVDAKQ